MVHCHCEWHIEQCLFCVHVPMKANAFAGPSRLFITGIWESFMRGRWGGLKFWMWLMWNACCHGKLPAANCENKLELFQSFQITCILKSAHTYTYAHKCNIQKHLIINLTSETLGGKNEHFTCSFPYSMHAVGSHLSLWSPCFPCAGCTSVW